MKARWPGALAAAIVSLSAPPGDAASADEAPASSPSGAEAPAPQPARSAPPAPPARPWLVASIQLTPFTAFPDFLGAGVTLHAVPFLDVEAGFAGVPYGWAYWARLGPRYQFLEARNERQEGWTGRVSARFGWKQTRTSWSPDSLGFSFAGCLDVIRFVAPRLGFGVHFAGGGLFDPRADVAGAAPRRKVTPELRLAFSVAF